MTARVLDLDLRRSLRRDAERIAAEHPDLTNEAHRERCADWLADEHASPVDEITGDENDTGDEHDRPENGGPAPRRR